MEVENIVGLYKPRFFETDNLLHRLSLIYPFLAPSDFHLPCLEIILSGTPFSAAALAPPDLRLCGLMFSASGKCRLTRFLKCFLT